MNALEYFGGVPKTMLTDQMKTVMLGMGDDRKPRWHPLFEDDWHGTEGLPRTTAANERQGRTRRSIRRAELHAGKGGLRISET